MRIEWNSTLTAGLLALIIGLHAVPAQASSQLITYNVFANLTGNFGDAFAIGAMTYHTGHRTFIEGEIFTTPSSSSFGSYPGRRYNQLNLVGEPRENVNPFLYLTLWEESATGVEGDYLLSMTLGPDNPGDLNNLPKNPHS